MDGVLCADDARYVDRAGAARSRLRRLRDQVLRPLCVDHHALSTASAPMARHVGRGRRLLLRLYSAARRHGGNASRCDRRWGCSRCAPSRCTRPTSATALPHFAEHVRAFTAKHPEVMRPLASQRRRVSRRRRLSVLNQDKLRRVLQRMLDPAEFLSPYGVRALSRFHLDSPYRFDVGGQELEVAYLPAESDSGMFGGNSNWRGPIWMPINALMIRALLQLHQFYGDGFTVECPTGSGTQIRSGRSRASSRSGFWPFLFRTRPAGVRCTAVCRRKPERSALERPDSVLRVFPRRQWRRDWREPSDRLDGSCLGVRLPDG